MNIEKNLLKRCKEKGFTISQLARLSGVKQPTLHGWTTGRSVHKIDDLKEVCRVLEISVHQLVFGAPDPFEINTEVFERIFSGELRITIHKIKNLEK